MVECEICYTIRRFLGFEGPVVFVFADRGTWGLCLDGLSRVVGEGDNLDPQVATSQSAYYKWIYGGVSSKVCLPIKQRKGSDDCVMQVERDSIEVGRSHCSRAEVNIIIRPSKALAILTFQQIVDLSQPRLPHPGQH